MATATSDSQAAQTLFSPADLAKRWGVGRSRLYQLFDRGVVKTVKLGASRKVRIEDVRAFEERLARDGRIE